MMYKLKNDGRDLIPISEIESLVISDDPQAITVFRNCIINALTTGSIRPRNIYGFQIDVVQYFKRNPDAIDDFTNDLVYELKRPRSIADFAKDVDPAKVKRWVSSRMERETKLALKDAVLIGYLTKDDVRAFLGHQGIAYEWISSQNIQAPMEASILQEGAHKSAPRIVISNTKTRRFPLDDAIDAAIEAHGYKAQSIWAQLIDWAQSKDKLYVELIGFTEEGIQYRGRTFQIDGNYDVLTYRQLSSRIRRRKIAHSKAR